MADALDRLRTTLADRYVIERELGRGGHAVVYLAHDLKHDRKVALKVLTPALAVRSERFLREIQIAAKLSHPHILPLYDSGEAQGFLYYVMPYVQGESLRERLRRDKQLAIADALRIAQDVVEGLGYAHAEGVVHRDIKPENILLSAGGAVVADFGIARAISAASGGRDTDAGLVVGTPAYMSPEQGGGSDVDARSDVYSLGCVVYEMLAGRPPFAGDAAQEILARHALDPVPALRTARPGVPRVLERAIARALAKVPADRFATAAAFAGALAAPRGRLPIYAAVGVIVLVASALVAKQTWLRPPAEQSVAVLPFVDMSGDTGNEYFSDGMTEDLIDALTQVSGLRIPARTSSFAFKGKNVPIPDVGRQLNVTHVVEGSVRRAGNQLRVTAQLINVADGYHLWSQHYERELVSARDIFAVQDEIAQAIVAALQLKLVAGVAERSDRPPTVNLQAYDLYERGRYQWYRRTPDAMQKAIGYFGQAIGLDSSYAPAYSGLADAYTLMGQFGIQAKDEVYPPAKTAALKAIQLDSNLAEAWVSLAQVRANYDWDWSGAEAAYQRGIRLNPKYPLGHGWYGRFLSEVMGVVGRSEEGIREARIAQTLDPLSTAMNAVLAEALRYGGHYHEAIEYYRRAIELEPGVALWHSTLAGTYLAEGEYREALAEVDTAARLLGAGSKANAGYRAYIAARTGMKAEAIRIVRELEQERSHGRGRLGQLAAAYLGLGDRDKAFDVLNQIVETRSQTPFFSGFLQKQLGSDPRFEQLLRQAGLKP